VLIRLNQIMRGWASYFRHAVSKRVRASARRRRVLKGHLKRL